MSGPWQSREEYLVDDALMRATSGTREQIESLQPSALARPLFPVRTGISADQPTIVDVLEIGQRAPSFDQRRAVSNSPFRSWLSGMPVRRSVMSDQSWSGTARNALSEGTW